MLLSAHSSTYVCTRMSTTILEHQSVKKRWLVIAWLKFWERPCNCLIFGCLVRVSYCVNFCSFHHFMIFQFWAFSDIQTGKVLMRVPAGDAANNGEVKLLLSLLTLYCCYLIWLNLILCSIMYPLVFLAKFIGIKQKVLLNFQTLLRDSSCMSTIKRFSLSVAMLKESVRPASKLVCMAFLNVCVFA